MNCNECPMRFVCDAILGGKDKCVYGICVPISGGTSDGIDDDSEDCNE